MIVGFDKKGAAKTRKKVETIVGNLDYGADAITTIVSADTKWCNNTTSAPYLIVRDTDSARATTIANALNVELKLDVEYETLAGFFASY
jgi:hypothetical protein